MEISKADLELLSDLRVEEAILLLNNGKYSGAYYLAGYSVELAIKARIASNFRNGFIPDKTLVNKLHTHNLSELIKLAGLEEKLNTENKVNGEFAGNWGVVKDWNEQARYNIVDVVNAKALLIAITDQNNGILKWLKKHY
jgi:HEPN domain